MLATAPTEHPELLREIPRAREDGEGNSLDQLMGVPMDVGLALRIGAKLAACLDVLHRRGIVHRDLKPQNILFDAPNGEVELTGFDLAVTGRGERWADGGRIQGTLPYMSPEQSGRFNRPIDGRSDLYSVGVILYEMLAGVRPFEAHDAVGWVRCHVARPPRPISNPRLPGPIADVVLKLLHKPPEERYQTAAGLLADLTRCLEEWQARGTVTPFALGSQDVSAELRIAKTLYGREQAAEILTDALRRVTESGSPRLVLVAGPAGIGKSSFVRSIDESVARAHGIFTAGRFEQIAQSAPYSAMTRALNDVLPYVFGEGQVGVEAWRSKFAQALGRLGTMLVDLVEPLEAILPNQPAVAELPPEGAQNRFYLAFRKFFSVLATKDHPVVLLLDDLEWADDATVALVEHLLTNDEPCHLLVLGTYRDRDGAPAQRVMSFASRMRERGMIDEITLAALAPSDVTRLSADSLRSNPERTEPLARLLWERTGGNPLSVTQLLANLHRDSLLTFDRQEHSWTWDLARVRAVSMRDDVVTRTIARIANLPSAARETLELASCLGSPFDARTLCLVTGEAIEETHDSLGEAVAEGLLSSIGNAYQFLHDRIRESIYEHIPESRRTGLHARIGRSLEAHFTREELERRIFDVAVQLNLGASALLDQSERDRVAALDLLAGRTAKASTAYAAARGYLSTGTALLSTSAWQDSYELTFDLHLELARCELLCGRPDEARRLVELLLGQARTALHQAKVQRLLIDIHLLNDRAHEAVATARMSVEALGIELSLHPTEQELLAADGAVWNALAGPGLERLLDLPPLHAPHVGAALETLATVLPSAHLTDPRLPCLIACRIVELSLLHGLAAPSALGCAVLAMEWVSRLGRPREGKKLAEVALRLADRADFLSYAAKTLTVVALFVAPHTGPMRTALGLLRRAYRTAIETGDLTVACLGCMHIVGLRLACGDRLDDIARESCALGELGSRAEFLTVARDLRFQRAYIEELQGLTSNGPSLSSEDFEAEHEGPEATRPHPVLRAWFHVRKLEALCLRHRYAQAVERAARVDELLWATTSDPLVSEYHLFAALAHAALASAATIDERSAHLRELAKHEHALAIVADRCPENFLYMHALVSAERTRLEGETRAAIRLYEAAIRSAHDNGFVDGAALAHEKAAAFYRELGLQTFADVYLREARRGYRAWGAHALVRALDIERPHMSLDRTATAHDLTVTTDDEALDQVSALKISQVISSETVRSKLLSTLTQLLSQQAGARKAVFISVRGHRWRVESTAGRDGAVPESIVNHVVVSHERVLLQDASLPGPYSADPYVATRHPRSVLCLPIMRRAELVGVVYLENDLVPAAFSGDTLTVLEVLVDQAAISLENARLHSDQQREIAERQQAQSALQAILDNIAVPVFVCDRTGHITLANPAGRRLIGLPAGKYLHTPISEVARTVAASHRDGTPFTLNEMPLLRALAGEVVSSIDMTVREVGTRRAVHLRVSAAPLQDERGAIAGAVSVAVNVTEAVELDRLKEQFIRVVAHELKTPIAIVKGYADVLRHTVKDAPESERRLLGALVRGADRIDQLVSDLLLVWQLQTGRLAPVVELKVDLVELVEHVVNALGPDAARRVSVTAPRPVSVDIDKNLLERVLITLVDNALRYSPDSGMIEIDLDVRQDQATVAVHDRGIGIPADKQSDLFEPFFRAHTDTPYDSGGLGLGLYLAKAIVTLHGGTIAAESEEGRGSTFRLTLPLRYAPPSRARTS